MKFKASPFAWVCFAMIVGVMGTALISPLYALYQEAWSLKASDVSLIYVIYMAGALFGLLFLGRLPDRLGFRPTMLAGLTLILAGTALSLAAWDMTILNIGRFIVGVASSLLTTSSTQGLARLSRHSNTQHVAMMTGFLMALGFGLGPLVGGIFGQWAPAPLRSTYVPTLLLSVLALIGLYRLSLPASARPLSPQPLRWSDVIPTLTWPDAPASSAFVLICCLPFLAFGAFGLYASMSPLFLDKLVPWHGPVVSGTAIALILFSSAGVQVLSSRLPTQYCGAAGLLGLALSSAILIANLSASSTLLFALGVILTSAGHGMTMLAGMSMINRLSSADNRSGLLATYLVAGYLGSIVPMMAIGWIADYWGLEIAVQSFCMMVISIGVFVAARFLRHPLMQPPIKRPQRDGAV